VADNNTIPVKVAITAEDQGVSAAIRQLGQELKNLKKNEQEAAEGAISLSKAFEGHCCDRRTTEARGNWQAGL
jgi:hypothetical protein